MRDCTVTIFNAYKDYATDKTEYYRAVIHGVTWQELEKTVISDKELQTADYANVFIHDVNNSDKMYLSADDWMNQASKEKVFTVKKMDYIAIGSVANIMKDDGRLDRNAIERYGVKRILSVSNKHYGSGADHIKVVAS